jgi:acetolactate decarboxylase
MSFISSKIKLVAICISFCFIIVMPGCGKPAPLQRETLTQVSTIDAILNGVYDGVIDFKTLKTYGDFGIGTFEGLDGEMLAYEGDFYQVKADGIAYPVDDTARTPFSSVTFFDTDLEENLPGGINYGSLPGFMAGLLPTENIFYAVEIKGTFSYVKTRSVPAQEKPYPPLVEVTAKQPTFEFEDVEGVIVGFLCPPYVSGLNVPGYHLHFLNSDKNAGGHVLEFTVKQAVISIDYTPDFLLILPGEDSDFYKLDLSRDKQDELAEAEK